MCIYTKLFIRTLEILIAFVYTIVEQKCVFTQKHSVGGHMIKRDYYLNKIISKQNNGMVKIITGIRRCGKSYLLFTLYRDYLLDSGVKPNHITALALDEISNQRYRNPNELDKYIKDCIINDGKTNYVFIDEIQFVKEVDNPYLEGTKVGFIDVLLGLMKLPNVDVYVTGSNSKMLSSDIVTEFRGRGDEIRIHPLSFKEFYDSYNGDKTKAWDEYSLYGGMPFLATIDKDEEKMNYLKKLLDTVYISDILERNNLKKDSLFVGELLDIIASSTGSLTSPTKLTKTYKSITNETVSLNTVLSYMTFFEDSFLISKAVRYDIKGKAYIDSPSKYYFEDIGLRNARLGFKERDITHIMESVIYNELILRGFNVDCGVIEHYFKNLNGKTERLSLEIDFVCNKGNKRYYIQSAYAIPDTEKRIQEIRGFLKIDDSFKKIVVLKECYTPWNDENGVLYIGLEDFLLNYEYLDE